MGDSDAETVVENNSTNGYLTVVDPDWTDTVAINTLVAGDVSVTGPLGILNETDLATMLTFLPASIDANPSNGVNPADSNNVN